MIVLKPIYVLTITGEIIKNATLTTTFHKPAVEANPYVRFGYGPLKISNTPKDKFQDQLTLIQYIWYIQINNQQKKSWTKKFKDIYIKQINKLMQTSPNTQLTTSLWPSTNLWGKHIHLSSLDTDIRKLSNTPGDKFQYFSSSDSSWNSSNSSL